jgi:hypothetical protein
VNGRIARQSNSVKKADNALRPEFTDMDKKAERPSTEADRPQANHSKSKNVCETAAPIAPAFSG